MKTKAERIGYALAGSATDPDKAENVLAFYCDAIESNEYPDPQLLQYVAKAFRAILDGENPSDALGLTRRKGQRRKRTLEQADQRDFQLARAVARRMKCLDEKKDDAIAAVVAQEGWSEATVTRAYDTFWRIAHGVEKKPWEKPSCAEEPAKARPHQTHV